MASTEILFAFAIATTLFAYFPGPALLYTAAQTLARGRRAGLMAALGIHIGCYAHVLGATLGLSAVFRYVPEAYAALKFAGAAYLVWLGIAMIRGGGDKAPTVTPKSARRAFAESIVVELLNPKVALFFIAFLPQFVDPAGAILPQFLTLGVVFSLGGLVVNGAVGLFAGSIGQRVARSASLSKWLSRISATIFGALALRLALMPRN